MTAVLLGSWQDGSPEWHAARASRIGGSEIWTICGWNQWQNRDDLLAVKRGEQKLRQSNAATERGHYLEPAIAAWLADKDGLTYDETKRGTWVDADRDWMSYNPDGITTDGRLVEFKSTAVRDAEHGWGRAGTDQVPLCYAAQVTWGMGILGLRECLLAVISGAPTFGFARYRITFNAAVFAYLAEQATTFYAEMTSALPERIAA